MSARLHDLPNGAWDDCGHLFEQARSGNKVAATLLYNRCIPPLRHWLADRLEWSLAEDVAQDAMISAFKYGSRFKPGSSFRSWLKVIAWRIALNARRNELRRRLREEAYSESMLLQADGESEAPSRQLVALVRCLKGLPQRDLLLLRLKFELGMTAQGIASSRGQNRGAVAVSLHRICRRLKQSINHDLSIGQSRSRQRRLQPC